VFGGRGGGGGGEGGSGGRGERGGREGRGAQGEGRTCVRACVRACSTRRLTCPLLPNANLRRLEGGLSLVLTGFGGGGGGAQKGHTGPVPRAPQKNPGPAPPAPPPQPPRPSSLPGAARKHLSTPVGAPPAFLQWHAVALQWPQCTQCTAPHQQQAQPCVLGTDCGGWRRCACLDATTRVLAVGALASTTCNNFIADLLFLSEVPHFCLVAGPPCVLRTPLFGGLGPAKC
jgi:hypothetical protein